ncbi:MAG: hypothetical protein GAK43_00203 [Stenotrophomonas maltophilia]|nr:MAG: hypothetical protein GAK43_00203 [Stenotrophomonas maltophilia]
MSDRRVLIGLAEKWGSLDQPRATGELYAINADGKRGELLAGYRAQPRDPGFVTGRKVQPVAAFLADPLADDENTALVTIWPFSDDPNTRLERMDLLTGRGVLVANSPVRRAAFTTDNKGRLRFAHGAGTDNVNKLFYR